MGFEMPFGTWLKNELKDRFIDILRSESAKEIFAPQFLKKCEMRIGDYRQTRILWTLFIFLEWYQRAGCTTEGMAQGSK